MALLRKCACYVLVCAAASSAAGCSEGRDPPPWISRCAAVGAGAELDLTVTAPADGSVRIPEALRPFMGGQEYIRPKEKVKA